MRLAGLLLLAAIASLALMPQPWKGRLATHGLLHAASHAAAFLAAGFLLTWRAKRRQASFFVALLILGLGLLLEYLQTVIYRNASSTAADAAGIAAALLLEKFGTFFAPVRS